MRVFLTGGTGLLGSHVAAALAQGGHDVVALVRPATDPRALQALASVVRGDILDTRPQLAARMAGCDTLVHAAALVYRRGARPADYDALNVAATETLLSAAADAGARRVLLVSSIAVYSPAAAARGNTEESWQTGDIPQRLPYAHTKRAGEEAAWRLHEEGRVRLTTVRPAVLYGERDRLFTPLLAAVAHWPVVPLPEGGRHTVPVVYAGNAARGITTALERPAAVGQAYNLSDDGPLTVRALIEAFARGLGRAPRIVSVPRSVTEALGVAGDAVARLVPGGANVPGVVERLLEDNAYPSAKAARELDWAAPHLVPPEEALARTAAWWRSTHL